MPSSDDSNQASPLFVNDQLQSSSTVGPSDELIARAVAFIPTNIEAVPENFDGLINCYGVTGQLVFVES